MRVLHISTSDSNGAGIAALRIMEAQRELGLDAQMLVRDKHTENANVQQSYHFKYLDYGIYRVMQLFGLDYMFSLNGLTIVNSKSFREADIVHIHNMHYARMLFPSQLPSNKKYVYTLHDMWGITGHCNYTYDLCDKFLSGCGNCPHIKNNEYYNYPRMLIDGTRFQWEAKQKAYDRLDITFTAPSTWLSELANRSLITSQKHVHTIPNCVPQHNEVPPKSRNPIPNLLFVGQKLAENDRKGFSFIVELCNRLDYRHIIHIVGNNDRAVQSLFTNEFCEVVLHGSMNYDGMERLYRDCDMLILPTMQDNLPNTILESFSFGTPVVAFDTGGVKDVVNSKTGYLARLKSVDDLVTGVSHVFSNLQEMSANILRNNHNYSYPEVAEQYKSLYIKATNIDV